MVNDWQVLDASGQVLGRFATQVAMLLMGKHKPAYVPHLLSGDFVVVINASEIKITGQKAQQKIYKRYSQYPGTLKEIPYERMQAKFPERIIEMAVKGMLPKSKLGRKMLGRMKVYAGPEHPHTAQVLGSDRRESREAEALVKAEAAAATQKVAAEKQAAKDAIAAEAKAKAETANAEKTVEAVATEAPAKKASAKKATVKKPAAKKPAAKEPAAKKTTAKKPAAKKATATKKPAAKKPAAKKTTAKKTPANKSGDSGEK